jgi:conjugal transfer protein trbG/virB9/cagX
MERKKRSMLKKIKNRNISRKVMFSLLAFALSASVFANDTSAETSVTGSKNVQFFDDVIVSGKQQGINRTNTIYDYTDNSIYEIYARKNYLTTLRLQEGEKIQFFAGGDTERWAIEESQGGKGNRPVIFIKPSIEEEEDDMLTNIIIVTDKHMYFLNIQLSEEKYNPLVEWRYPNEAKIIREAQERNTTVIGTDDLTKLNYGYNWNRNSVLSPMQVFDNGEHTFIVLKDRTKEMPAIYVKGVDGQISFVTPKINGKYITIDRVTEEITLEIGKQKLKIRNIKK